MTDTISLSVFTLGGLLLGSFVNVLIYRLPLMILATESAPSLNLAWPASHCPQCQHPIAWYHNIPVLSFLLLRGQCAHCQHAIAWRYPFTEIAVAMLWGASAWHWGATPQAAMWGLFFTLLYALSVIDWRTTLLPDTLTRALLWSGLLGASVGLLPLSADQSVVGAAAGYCSLWCLATCFRWFTDKEGMGAGDFKLLAGIGAWLGWALLPWIALGASVLGLLVALTLMTLGRMKRSDYLPFGPMIAATAAFLAWLGTDAWLSLVLHLAFF